MPMVYATLISLGAKEYKDVPSVIKEQVAVILRELQLDHLITD